MYNKYIHTYAKNCILYTYCLCVYNPESYFSGIAAHLNENGSSFKEVKNTSSGFSFYELQNLCQFSKQPVVNCYMR